MGVLHPFSQQGMCFTQNTSRYMYTNFPFYYLQTTFQQRGAALLVTLKTSHLHRRHGEKGLTSPRTPGNRGGTLVPIRTNFAKFLKKPRVKSGQNSPFFEKTWRHPSGQKRQIIGHLVVDIRTNFEWSKVTRRWLTVIQISDLVLVCVYQIIFFCGNFCS